MFAGIAVLELYLVATALAEGSGQLWAVFPQYIALPQHQFFGRAGAHFSTPRPWESTCSRGWPQ